MTFLQLCKLYWDKAQPQYPDDVDLWRVPVANDRDYYRYILEKLRTENNAYTHFYSKLERDTGVIFKLLLDVDNEDKRHPLKTEERYPKLKERWDGMRLFMYTFWDSIEVYFSGKGFHIYVYTPATKFDTVRDARDDLYLNLTTWLQSYYDKGVFLSLDRECRIPMSKHSKFDWAPEEPPRWKVPVNYKMSIDDILARSFSPQNYILEFHRAFMRPIRPIPWQTFLKSPSQFVLGQPQQA